MDRNEIRAINQALTNSVLPGGGAVAGVIALCHELVVSGTLSPAAARRVGAAIIADINGTPAAEHQARSRLANHIGAAFRRYDPPEEEQSPQQ